jgi:hypothetical protein
VILPIYGFGGISKTTFAKLIFGDAQFNDYSRVWVYVSQVFDSKKIGNSIISQVSNNGDSYIIQNQMINKRLQELLAGKKILVVLDDMWRDRDNECQLKELRAMLRVGEGSKVVVLVTTRDVVMAKELCTIEPHKLDPLTDDMCWTIIKQKSDTPCSFGLSATSQQYFSLRTNQPPATRQQYFSLRTNQPPATRQQYFSLRTNQHQGTSQMNRLFESKDCKEQLEHLGRCLAMRCGGVALVAQTFGYMLRSMTFDEWKSVRDSDIWNVSATRDARSPQHKVLASLRLSYNSMPPYLKLCFGYCATFPKGYNIAKGGLIHQWISLGLH